MWSLDQSIHITWELVVQILRPTPESTQSETLGVGPSDLYFNKPSPWFLCIGKFENDCTIPSPPKSSLFPLPVLAPHCSDTHLPTPALQCALWSTCSVISKSPCIYYTFQESSPYLLALTETHSLRQQPSGMVDLYSHLFTAGQALILLPSITISRPLLVPHPLVKNPLPLRLMPCGYTTIPPSHHSSLLCQAHPGSLQSPEWWLTTKPLNFLTILSPPTFSFVLYFALWNCFSSHITNISLPFPNHRFLHYSLLGQLFPLWSFSNLFGIPRPKSYPLTLYIVISLVSYPILIGWSVISIILLQISSFTLSFWSFVTTLAKPNMADINHQ